MEAVLSTVADCQRMHDIPGFPFNEQHGDQGILQQCLSTEWIGQLEETDFDTGQGGSEDHFLPFLFDGNTGFA
ncbi:hypothetical protein N7449_011991 [Penicillium cf. viridicatum]|uniref:Uncharacterized protein n=1 Tax=Penicillium cf. viridicatum TaxID=2972119 RepID=A0A9W9IMR1_9EURO|nr:hypothetical protein N7449_011991 [Penicillium cf. viridicatum]